MQKYEDLNRKVDILENKKTACWRFQFLINKSHYEQPQSESQPGFPFLNFLEAKFFLMILNREYPANSTIAMIKIY